MCTEEPHALKMSNLIRPEFHFKRKYAYKDFFRDQTDYAVSCHSLCAIIVAS